MKDRVLLCIVAVVCSAASWIFWHFLGEDAMIILLNIVLVSFVFDNIRLRRKLHEQSAAARPRR